MNDNEILKIIDDDDFFANYFDNNSRILKSLEFARRCHKNQLRKTGIPFIIHPIAVAIKLWEKYKDEDLTICGFLHDTIEDGEDVEISEVYDLFGEKVGFLIDAMNKYEKSFYKKPNMIFDEKIERFLWGGVCDFRLFILKIADRAHNLESIEALKDNKQVRMAFETQAIFEPLKQILGYDEDISLKEIRGRFKGFLEEISISDSDLTSISKLKKYLYSKSFNNLDDKSFSFVYKNSSNIIWRVEGLEMFNSLCEQDSLKDKIDLISMSSNGDWVHIDFRFLKGLVDNKSEGLKMSISSFTTG